MDPDALVDEMTNIISDLDGMKRGYERTQLMRELNAHRQNLRAWKLDGGFEPNIGWPAALRL